MTPFHRKRTNESETTGDNYEKEKYHSGSGQCLADPCFNCMRFIGVQQLGKHEFDSRVKRIQFRMGNYRYTARLDNELLLDLVQ